MDFWGCEFLDLESYSEPENSLEDDKMYFPIDFLFKIADQQYLTNIIRKDEKYIRELIVDISKNGLIKELKITMGTNGLMLGDGHHRLCAMRELKYEYVPANLKISNSNLKIGVSYFKIMERILQDYAKRKKDIK